MAIKPWMRVLMALLISVIYAEAFGDQEEVFHTGLEADRANVAVSPNGRQVLLDTNHLAHGLKLLNVSNSEVRTIPPEAGRTIGFPSWLPDGRQVAVVSAAVPGGQYSVDDMKIVLLDSVTWASRSIATGDGVKFSPFFSDDGKAVYYFKGKKRESGKTPASRYDLFAIELASGVETRITYEEGYQMGKGDDDGHNILFNAYGLKRFSSKDPVFGFEQTALFALDISSDVIRPVKIDQSSGIFDFYHPQRDRLGNYYFITTKFVRRENFHWYLAHTDKYGNNAAMLTELPVSMSFDIARNTGDIYVTDRDGKELIIRKLSTKAAN